MYPQNISVCALFFEHSRRRTVSEADGLGDVPELIARSEHRSHPWRCVSANNNKTIRSPTLSLFNISYSATVKFDSAMLAGIQVHKIQPHLLRLCHHGKA